MVWANPFNGIRYSKKIDPGTILAPPYDFVSPEEILELAKRSPYNISHMTMPKGGYARAGEIYQKFRKINVLQKDPKESLYLIQRKFKDPDTGKVHERKEIYCLVKLENYEQGIVIPHERTLQGPIKGRLELLRNVGAHLSPILMAYSDIDNIINDYIFNRAGKKLLDIGRSGNDIKMFSVTNPDLLENFTEEMVQKWLLIADGHHRYETALAYQKSFGGRPGPHDYILAGLINIDDSGTIVRATHRITKKPVDPKKIKDKFEFIQCQDKETMLSQLEKTEGTFGMYNGTFYLMTPWEKIELDNVDPNLASLDVMVLQETVFRDMMGIEDIATAKEDGSLKFETNVDSAINLVNDGYSEAYFVRPTPKSNIIQVAQNGVFMPQKSTNFFPKLDDGTVIYEL